MVRVGRGFGMDIERWSGAAVGRSHAVAHAGLVWTVANTQHPGQEFDAQVIETLQRLEANLAAAGSSKSRMLSVHVLLTDIGNREAFDRRWLEWIGNDPAGWPQRACYGAPLAPGLLLELVVTAARNAPHP
jgi:enamine deaminase RidA (YjgF/YER057c/UK114 family)